MERALAAYRSGGIGFNECCRQYGIPKPTLKRHLDSKNVRANDVTKALGRTTTLPLEIEKELVEHIFKLEGLLFGLTITDVRKLAYQIAQRNNIPHNFNNVTKMAGKKWFYSFKARHKDITLREPEATSMARARGFNKKNISEFFDILKKVVDENQIDATRLFNVDESGISTVQNKCQKILAKRGKRQVGSISSGERGLNTTIVCCTSASGMYIPPMLIFKKMRMANELKVGASPGGLVDVSETGYMTSELFVKWLSHFILTVKPSREKRVLLLLDGHTTHSKNLEALEMARRNAGVIMLQLPGHTTHRVQPLDKTFFKPSKAYYTQAVEKWLRTNPGLCVTQYQVAQLVAEAYAKAATIENSVNGFRSCGIWPVDHTIFKDSDFLPVEYLDSAEDENMNAQSVEMCSAGLATVDEAISNVISVSAPKINVSFEDISPLPKPKSRVSKKGKMKTTTIQRGVVLTSSPYKNELQTAKELQAAQAKVKELKLKITQVKADKLKRVEFENKKHSPGKENKKPSVQRNLEKDLELPSTSKNSSISVEINHEEWFCSVCEEYSIEDMVQCLVCSSWVHEMCAGVKSGLEQFVCTSCKQY